VFYLLSFLFWIISIDATYMLLNEFFSPLVYDWVVFPLIIFLARMTDVSLGTLRSVLASKGKKKIVPFIGFVEVLIWLFAISSILQNLHSITSYLAWAGGYATGIYLGLVIEEKLAIGNQVMRIITNQDCEKLIETIKQANFGITVLDGHGARGPVKLIFIVLKRKEVENIINLLNLYNPNAFYSVEDIKEANQIRYSTMYQRNNLFNKVFPVRKGL